MKDITRNSNNISYVVTDDMCTGCGFCAAFCPYDAIKIVRDHAGFNMPIVLRSVCVNCGICLDVCPGYGLQLNRWSQKLINAPFHSPYLGKYTKVYIGYARDMNVRWTASSGGIATALLLYMLRNGSINGAVVAVSSSKNPLHAEAMVATSEEDILRATGSKYTPLSMDKVLRQLVKDEGNFAFVGLPCHIEALRKAEERFTKLKRSIVLRIGLYCGNTPSVLATQYLLWRFKIPIENLREIKYRGQGWPGQMTIELKNEKQIKIPFAKYYDSGFGQFFCKKRCILCADYTAELADISLGDPWFPELMFYERIGQSVIVARTLVGLKMIEEAWQAGIISLKEVNPQKVIPSTCILKKRSKLSHSVKTILGIRSLPYNFEYSLPLNLGVALWLFIFRINSFLASYEKLWPLLRVLTPSVRIIISVPITLLAKFKRLLKTNKA